MGSLEGVVSGMYWNKCLKVNAYSENRSRKPEARGLKLPGTAFAGFALFTLLRHLFSCRFPNKTAQVLSILRGMNSWRPGCLLSACADSVLF
jgi:hypothetical protein